MPKRRHYMADDKKNNKPNSKDAVKARQANADTRTVSTPSKGGDDMAKVKDPEGMFDYSNCPTYTVKEGDTLLDIAQSNSVALQQLRYFNHINKATLKIKAGQVLFIPKKPINVPTGE